MLLFSKRHSCFIVNFVNFLKTTFLQNNFGRLILSLRNVFATSINLLLFSQYGFSRNKSLEAVVCRCSSKMMFLKFHKFHEKTCVGVSFYIDRFVFLKRPATLLKKDSNTSVFKWNLGNFLEHFFHRTPPVAAC